MIPFGFQIPFKSSGCEDAPPVYSDRCSVVCDGLGGSGSRRHCKASEKGKTMEEHTSAYIGSRLVADCVTRFIDQNYDALQTAACSQADGTESIPGMLSRLKKEITADLERGMAEYRIPESAIRGRTFKVFPTTLAAAVYFPQGEETVVLGLWAGDSRIYLLTPDKGLQLLSRDDSDIADEMGSVSEMNNCISADGDYWLNYAVYRLHSPQAAVFCCSDGCFDMICSPMHLEWLWLYGMLNCNAEASGPETGTVIAESIRNKIYESPCDDTTMCGALIGMDSTAAVKEVFGPRFESFNPAAKEMNKAYSDWKSADGTLQRLDKEQRLLASEADQELKRMIFNAFKGDNTNPLYMLILNRSGIKPQNLFTAERSRMMQAKLDNLLIAAEQLKDELQELYGALKNRVMDLKQQLQDRTLSERMVDMVYPDIREDLLEDMTRLEPVNKELLPQSLRRYTEIITERKQEMDRSSVARAEVERLWEKYRINYQLFSTLTEKGEV